ncbi:MAG: hypothetical protein WC329_05645 [Candidatus Omnitrophota bacterium]|nr:hypothetical protein [Candidatus Omnitrophota bacterium]
MKNRRSMFFWKTKFTLLFFNIALLGIALFCLAVFYGLGRILTEYEYSLGWRLGFILLEVGFMGFIFSILISMFLVLHRILGPLPRIESVLSEVIKGNHSLRVTIRKRDMIHGLVDKINAIIELLEKKK